MPRGRPRLPLPADLVRRYVKGELSAVQLAALAGCSRDTAEDRLREAGVLRSQAQAAALFCRKRSRHARRDATIRQLHGRGWTQAALAGRFGVTTARIRQILSG